MARTLVLTMGILRVYPILVAAAAAAAAMITALIRPYHQARVDRLRKRSFLKIGG